MIIMTIELNMKEILKMVNIKEKEQNIMIILAKEDLNIGGILEMVNMKEKEYYMIVMEKFNMMVFLKMENFMKAK